jgi:hypothetical protein
MVDTFVTEEAVDDKSRPSSVILIPYSRFFQSGVALRSIELGTPVVGPCDSSLGDLVGSDSPGLVDGDDWPAAINAATSADADELTRVARDAYRRVVDAGMNGPRHCCR